VLSTLCGGVAQVLGGLFTQRPRCGVERSSNNEGSDNFKRVDEVSQSTSKAYGRGTKEGVGSDLNVILRSELHSL